ncbi:unnamed protein product [Lathyrus sativus]|nr:unnamed protein product [Lathyrus sativus]
MPLLEMLDISLCDLSTKSLEVVGQYCPLLTVLVLVRSGRESIYDVYDDEAFVIAKTMFGLRQLYIIGNELSNAGLIAILDGCPHLESLDIRRCYNLRMDEISKKCFDHIKNLQLPEPRVFNFDDFDDYFYVDHVTYRDSIIDEDCYDPYD